MKAYQTRFVPLIALLASACGGANDEPTLNHYGDETTESVDAVQASLSSHHAEVLGETDLGRMRSMEQRHKDDMGMHMGRMLDAQDSMELCGQHMSAAGHTDAVKPLHEAQGAMGEAIDDASAEVERHLLAMEDAPDVATALTDEHQHQTAMDQLLDRMRTHDEHLAHAMQAMQDDGISMMCPMNSHMHRQH